MANISYPKFGKVKTIVLPIPDSPCTLDEYKDTYGIDLEEFVSIQGNFIGFKVPANTQILLDISTVYDSSYPVVISLVPLVSFNEQEYDYENDDAISKIGGFANNADGEYYFLELSCDKDTELSIENIKVNKSITY